MKANGKGDVRLADVIDWGQGYDDDIMELFKAFKKFRDGYYELINYDDDWWRLFNQGTDFDEIMEEAWKEIDDKYRFMTNIEKMAVAMAGTYVRFNKYVDAVLDAYEKGNGLRHDNEQGAEP